MAAASALGPSFRVDCAALRAPIVHYSHEQTREQPADHEDPAEHRYRQQSVSQFFHRAVRVAPRNFTLTRNPMVQDYSDMRRRKAASAPRARAAKLLLRLSYAQAAAMERPLHYLRLSEAGYCSRVPRSRL